MAKRLQAMLRKEFTQLFHDWPILFILAWAFSGAIYVAGNAISIEVNEHPTVVIDLSRSALSRELLARIQPPYFKIVGSVRSDDEVLDYLDSGKASLAIIIPPDFERKSLAGMGRFQVISDGTMSQISIMATSYIARIAAELNIELLTRRLGALSTEVARFPQIDARNRVAYNANIESAWFASLLELMNMITMVSMLLTAAAMVREKVYGTMEQLLVSPLRPLELFLSKIIPTVLVVVALSLVGLFGLVQGVFDTPIRGSLLLFYSVMAIYVFSIASLGLLIAVFSSNLAQAMMSLFLILMPMLFLSGAFTPAESMAPWMQYTSLLSPMRYFMDFGYQVLFKGNGLEYVWHDIAGIVICGGTIFGLSLWRFKKRIA
ncbi:MAG: ABC transporter permease [Gammaproteobacteria bacterium]|nr:ABC transporter permease [Gammaproteobacteria bacterium]MBQ0840338.1 ABC transporter permease [Gammaproteobacteria bacterium]